MPRHLRKATIAPRVVAITAAALAATSAPAQPGTAQGTGSAGPSGAGAAAPDPYAPQALPFADPSTIEAYVNLLNEEDLATRMSAADFILQSPTIALGTITPYLTNTALPPETRSRLTSLASLLFRVEPRAAMGIQFERASALPVIIRSFPDSPYFRAHEVLEPGDEVVEADGRVVESFDHFQGAILSHDPGESMLLKVRRNNDLVDVKVPLGDFMRLGLSMPPEPTLNAAWEIRLERILAQHADNLTPALDCRLDQPPPTQPPASTPGASDRDRPPSFLAAGAGRGGIDQNGQAVEATPIEVDQLSLQVRDMLRRQGLTGDALRQAERDVEALLERRTQMLAIRDRVLSEIDSINQRLGDTTLDLDTRRRLSEMLARAHMNLATAQNQIDLIDLQLPQRQ